MSGLSDATSVATIVGAAGAFVSAVASLFAARKSSEAASRSATTARDAADALARALKPRLSFTTQTDGDPGGLSTTRTTVHGVVHNRGDVAAVDVHVEWVLMDGRTVRADMPRLERSPGSWGGATWIIDLGAPVPIEDDPYLHGVSVLHRVAVAYADERRIRRWETVMTRPTDEGALSGAWPISDRELL